jgi:anti-sigma B factor antagonist
MIHTQISGVSRMEKVPLATYTEEVNGIPILNAVGEIDLSTASIFKKAISDLIDSGNNHVLIDMSQVAFMDSSGFGTLLSAIKVLRPQNGSLSLASCNDAVNRMLDITRLNTLFHVYPSRAAALTDMERRTTIAQPA